MLSFQERYKECKDAIRELSLQTEHKLWIGLFSVLLAMLIMIGPICLLINCIIFNDFMDFIFIGIILCIYLIIFLSRIFYYKTITKKQVEDMKCFYLVDAGACAIVLCVGVFIGLFI